MATEAKNVKFRSSWRSWKPAEAQAGQGQDAAARAHPHSHALQTVRPAACGVSQVRHLPYLFPQHGQRWLIPGVKKASW